MTNFHRDTASDKGAIRVKHHAKAASAGSTQAGGSSRGLFRCALVRRGGFGDAEGTGAPSSRRAPIALLAVLATIAALAFTAAPAFAAIPTVTTPIVSAPSYTTAHVTSEVDPQGTGLTSYIFQVSTNGTDWINNTAGVFFQKENLNANLSGLADGTQYSVRLVAAHGFSVLDPPEVISAGPNPSFTTLTADPTAVVLIENASEVSYTTATATGKIKRPVKSDNVACHFEYITDAQFAANEGNSEPGFTGATAVGCEPEESVATIGDEVPVSAKLANLANKTTYHLRLVVSNAANTDAKEAPSTFITLTVDPPSVVSTDNATEVEYTQAQVKGVVERPANADPAFDVECNFEYITDAQFAANEGNSEPGFTGATPVACNQNPVTAADTAPGTTKAVSATLTTLTPETTYHLRLSASNQGGSDAKEAAATFATAGPVPKPTVISVSAATGIGTHTATVTGEVQRPAGADPALDAYCRFEFVSDSLFDENEANALPPFEGAIPAECQDNPVQAGETGEVKAQAFGLEPATEYHYRLVAENLGGPDSQVAGGTFNTVTLIPTTLTINSIANVTYQGFTIDFTADPGNQGVKVPHVEWAPTGTEEWSSSGSSFPDTGAGAPPLRVSATFPCGFAPSNPDVCVAPLKPGTTYKVRLAGNIPNEDGTDTAITSPQPYPEITTKGSSTPPSATLDPVTTFTGTTAHFTGSVDANAPSETLPPEALDAYRTVWSLKCIPACGNHTGTVEAGEGSQLISINVANLDTNTHYKVKLTAKNTLATVEPEQTFDTPLVPPSVKNLPGGSDGEGGYILAGTVNPNHSEITGCTFYWGPNSAAKPEDYAFQTTCSPAAPGDGGKPVTVEAHLPSLNVGAHYHAILVIKSAFGEADDGDFEFIPTLAPKGEPCSNEELREENNSLALPECRAYEQVTYPAKEGWGAYFLDFDGGDSLAYESGAPNLANSGAGGAFGNKYVATRTAAGWKTIADLNGPSGATSSGPEFVSDGFTLLLSKDLLTSVWRAHQEGGPEVSGDPIPHNTYLRQPSGKFVLAGLGRPDESEFIEGSDDLSHVLVDGLNYHPQTAGVLEIVGTGENPPRRIDLDNLGDPVSECATPINTVSRANHISRDGKVIVFSVNGTGGTCANGYKGPELAGPVVEGDLWARVDATTSYKLNASRCSPACALPEAPAIYQGAATDGSRVYFTTTAQLLNTDTDKTNDLYACDIPTTPQDPVGKANPCAALHEVSGSASGANVVAGPVKAIGGTPSEDVTVSDDGSTAYFTASGVLADNEDALGGKAMPDDENLYVWRTDATHPDGQTTFVARNAGGTAQTTSDGRYLLLLTRGALLESDTDNSLDVYRYDADTEEMTRVSTGVSGVGGNGEFDARLGTSGGTSYPVRDRFHTAHHSHFSISDDGEMIVFTTDEALSPLDGNGYADAYLWKAGHLVGSVAPLGPRGINEESSIQKGAYITGDGNDIYVKTSLRLSPSDVDTADDLYDVRVDGGFAQPQPGCSGEACQPPSPSPPPRPALPTGRPPADPGNVEPKTCPKGKVAKGKKCVKKPHKKHHKKQHAKRHERAGSDQGGGK